MIAILVFIPRASQRKDHFFCCPVRMIQSWNDKSRTNYFRNSALDPIKEDLCAFFSKFIFIKLRIIDALSFFLFHYKLNIPKRLKVKEREHFTLYVPNSSLSFVKPGPEIDI